MTKIVGPAILYTPKIPNMKSWISQWFYNPFGKMTMEHKPEQIRTGSAPDCDRGNVWFCFECIPFSNGNTFRIPDHFWKEDLNLCVDSKPACQMILHLLWTFVNVLRDCWYILYISVHASTISTRSGTTHQRKDIACLDKLSCLH
jgi:hypothetical protein